MEIQERWWHRLVKILLIGTVVCVSLMTLAFSSSMWSPYTTRHSWDKEWDNPAEAKQCAVSVYSEQLGAGVNCGSIYKPVDLFNELVASGFIRDMPEFRQASEYQQGRAMDALLTKTPQYYWSGNVFSPKGLLFSIGLSLTVLAVLGALAFGLWRSILYVAHGRGARLIR